MRLTRIDHVQLAMPEGREDEARRFWVELCGLQEVPKPPASAARGGCWFERHGVVVHVGVERPFAPARKAHVALCVEDLDALGSRFTAAGIAIVPADDSPDRRRFHVADPFGNRLELIADGDGFSQR